MSAESKSIRLADYKAPEFTADHVDLNFDIQDKSTIVTAQTTYKRTEPVTDEYSAPTRLVLNAENPNADSEYLMALEINGQLATENKDYFYNREDGEIIIPVPANQNEVSVRCITNLQPQHNSQLSGLYNSGEPIVTQCETWGYRRITPFLDRPDVMATYRVTVQGDKTKAPVLLSNGDEVAKSDLLYGRHQAVFNDPDPKPSYLFALAAGDFDYVEDTFTNMNGREVTVRIYTEPGKAERAVHALEESIKSFLWEEKNFGQAYELDNFRTVAVSKFTYGAMENTSLNIFRDILILASPETATDGNYRRIGDVVGHEIFHHNSGNHPTLRNWPNLSVKEGLTVLREQMYTADNTSWSWERIRSASELRNRQFLEDDGPMAMPVVPPELTSVNNIYNGTTYDKGAEVNRMMMVMSDRDTFQGAIADFFNTYKHASVTNDELVAKIEEHTGLPLSGQFRLWHSQSGRPRVKAEGSYDAKAKTYTLTLEQAVPPTADQSEKEPMYIPVKTALVDEAGNDLSFTMGGTDSTTEKVLHFTKDKQTFVFENVEEEPAFHSVFRDFSAPVTFNSGLSAAQLRKQALTDSNDFCRWDAGQTIALKEMKRLYNAYRKSGEMPDVSAPYIELLRDIASDNQTDPALIAHSLVQPSITELEQAVKPADPGAIAAVRKHMKQTIGKALYGEFKTLFEKMNGYEAPKRGARPPVVLCKRGVRTLLERPESDFSYQTMGVRDLKRTALGYMMTNGGAENVKAAKALYDSSSNATDQVMAMGAINNHFGAERDSCLADYYERFKDDALVIQKWFSMQGSADSDGVFDNIIKIADSDVFDWTNPGHVSALFGALTSNYNQFHRDDGKGYAFLADAIIKLDKINGATAARFVDALSRWKDYSGKSQAQMIEQLERLSQVKGLSVDVKDKVEKSLPKKDEQSITVPAAGAPTPGVG